LGYDDGFRPAPAGTIKAAGLAYLHVKLHFRPGDRAATEAASIAAVNPGSTAAGTGDTARTGADSTITPSRCSTPSIGNPTDEAVTVPQANTHDDHAERPAGDATVHIEISDTIRPGPSRRTHPGHDHGRGGVRPGA
jgi:hypothetical protein